LAKVTAQMEKQGQRMLKEEWTKKTSPNRLQVTGVPVSKMLEGEVKAGHMESACASGWSPGSGAERVATLFDVRALGSAIPSADRQLHLSWSTGVGKTDCRALAEFCCDERSLVRIDMSIVEKHAVSRLSARLRLRRLREGASYDRCGVVRTR